MDIIREVCSPTAVPTKPSPSPSSDLSSASVSPRLRSSSREGEREMGSDAKVYTLAEVSAHNTPQDCWLVVNGKVGIHLSYWIPSILPRSDHFFSFLFGSGDVWIRLPACLQSVRPSDLGLSDHAIVLT